AVSGSVGCGIAAVSSSLALALYSRIRAAGDVSTNPRQHPLREFAEGLAAVGGNFVFKGLIGLAMFNSLFGMSYVTLLPIFADTYFKAGSTGYGMLNAAQGLGSLVGTLTIATIAHRLVRRGRIVLAVAACVGVELMLFALAPFMWLALPV